MRMKKVLLPLMTLVMMGSAALSSRAETVAPYPVDFNTPINTNDHDFRVASNWGHIVHKYSDGYSDYWMSYSYKATDGVDGTGALYAGEQRAGDNWDYEYTYDLLVTPIVKGEVSLKIKRDYSTSAYVELWSVYTDNGILKRLNKIKEIKGSSLSQTEWTALTYSADTEDGERIGIRASRVYLDDFTAESAEVEPEKGLTIVHVSPNPTSGTMEWDQAADGTTSKEFKVVIENTGDIDLAPGDEGYSLSLAKTWGDNSSFYTMPIEVPLAKKTKSDTIVFTPVFDPVAIWGSSSYRTLAVKENISGSTVRLQQAQYNQYKNKFLFRVSGSTSSYSADAQNYGMLNEPKSKAYEIYNDGVAPLEIKSVSIGEGFTLSEDPGTFTLQGKEKKELSIAITEAPGAHEATLSIVYTDNDGSEKTFSLAFSGVMLGENTWSANFYAEGSTPEYPAGSVVENGVGNGYNYNSSAEKRYEHYLKCDESKNLLGQNKFITPKLHAAAGDTFTFGLSRMGSKATDEGYIKVYVTDDRNKLGEPTATYNATDYVYNNCKTFESKTVTIPTEGDYYIVFELYNMAIDNLFGLEEVPVAHDIYTVSYALEYNSTDSIQSGVSFKPEFKFIPLTAAEASDYAIKFYLEAADGTKEATPLESIKLDAASKGYKTFKPTVTKTVESTTVFKSYFTFEYTDGTVLTSTSRELTITNESKFHFIDKDQATVVEPTDRKAAIAFGKTNEFGKKLEFAVYNWGTAPLTVKSVSVPENFVTNIDGEFTVAGKERQIVEISFIATEPDIYEGKLEITYVDTDGTDKTFELPVSGTMLDPEKWYVPFQKEKADGSGFEYFWPEGSLHQKNLSTRFIYSTGEFEICSTANTDNLLTTPKLTATAGEKFTFDAKANNRSVETVIKVFAAKTREALEDAEARTELLVISNKDDEAEATELIVDQYKTFTITFAEAGDYYLGLELGNQAYIDDLYGLKLTPVVADLKVMSTTIPANAMQNVASAVAVEVLNLNYKGMGASEYSFKVHVGDKVTEIAANDTIPVAQTLTDTPVSLSATMRSPKPGTVPVFVEVVCGDYSVSSDTIDVTFIPEVASSEKVVGISNGTTGNYPLYLNYKNSQSINLFPADMLGLAPGTKITSITLKGYKTSDAADTDVEMYYQWTDEQTLEKPASPTKYNTEGMSEYFKGSFHWDKKGQAGELAEMLTFNFAEPVEYEAGKALKLYFSSSADAYKAAYFECTNTAGAYYTYEDGVKGTFSVAWREAKLPVLYLGLAVDPASVAGKVSDAAGAAVEGATVTLVSTDGDDIQYEGATDAEGNYSINVVQNTRHYDVTVTAADGRTATAEDIDPAAQTEALDFVLYTYVDVKGKVTDALGNAVEAATVTFTATGIDVPELVYTAETDAEGNYTAEGVREDLKYNVSAEKDGKKDLAPEYSPKADEALNFKLIGLVTVTGTVTDATGAPIEGARVIFADVADDNHQIWLSTDAEGKYSCETIEDHRIYKVTASANGVTETVENFDPKAEQTLNFKLVSFTNVNGTVTDAAGAAIADAQLTFTDKADASYSVTATTDAEGKYSVSVESHRTYTASATANGITETVEDFDPKAEQTLNFKLVRTVTLNDETEGIEAATDVTVKFELPLEAGHNAIVLPMALTAEETQQIFGNDVEVYTYHDHKGSLARFILSGDKVLEAGVPYLIVSTKAAATATFTGKTLVAEPTTVRGEKLHFTGTFAAKAAEDGIFALTEDNFVSSPAEAAYAATAAESIKPFRAYITSDDSAVTAVTYTTSDFYSGIEDILVGTDEEPVIYNLNGVRVYNPAPGVYIVNGKKTLIK